VRALVTGAGGQLGRTVARVLADGCDVVPLTRAGIEMPHWRDAVARYARLRG
jgi:dTDP-4-dehydrorhamnose reductase